LTESSQSSQSSFDTTVSEKSDNSFEEGIFFVFGPFSFHQKLINHSNIIEKISDVLCENDPATSTIGFNSSLKPIRPTISAYPLNSSNNKFNSAWYDKHMWLEYSKSKNAAFCFVCRHFGHQNNSNKKVQYTKDGFTDFRNGPKRFREHERCEAHVTATTHYLNRISEQASASKQLSSQHAKKVSENRSILQFIIQTIMFLVKQGLALRGHDETKDSFNQGNFLELINFQCKINQNLNRDNLKYTCKSVQNEIINIISKEVLKLLLPSACSYFAIMVDETQDIARHEQVSVCIRYIDDKLAVKEKFVGFYKTDSTTAEALCQLVLDALESFGLDYSTKLVGQCYDGASNMSGVKNGLNKKIKAKAKKALYIHCYAHQLNLALQHSCTGLRKSRECLDTLNSLHSFIEGSAKRHSLFQLIQEPEFATVLKHLSDTRWASRESSLSAMKQSFPSVIQFLQLVEEQENNDVGTKASRLLKQVIDYDFLFQVYVLQALFAKTSILNKSLQSSTLDMTTALDLAELTIKELIDMKTNGDIDTIISSTLKFAEENGIQVPSGSNQRGRPSREIQEKKRLREEVDPLDKYKASFGDILDTFIDHLSEKFKSDNYKPLIAISTLLTSKTKPDLSQIFWDLVIYRDDYNYEALDIELVTWYAYKKKHNLETIKDIHKQFASTDLKSSMPNIFNLLAIFLTVPVTSVHAERSFSTLKRLKSWLRSTMGQCRLSSLAIIQMNPEELLKVSLEVVIDIFATSNKKRKNEFF